MRTLATAFSVVLLTTIGCSSPGDSDDDGASEARITSDALGGSSSRLLAAFANVGGIDHASGGQRGIRASEVVCLRRSNAALGENDAMFQVPTTECTYESEGYSTPFSKKDEPLAATLVFDALEAVIPQDAVSHEAGNRAHVSIDALICEGRGLGGGFEPSKSPPFTAKCELAVTGADSPIQFEGAPARRLLRALGFANATDHSNGGTFGSSVKDLRCEKNGNGPLGEDNPMQGIAHTQCTLVWAGNALSVVDPKQDARALFVALEKAGVVANSASGGVRGVMTDAVSCYEKPGTAARCTLAK